MPSRRARGKKKSDKPDSSGSLNALLGRGWKHTETYAYTDEDGVVLCENCRLELFDKSGVRLEKTFRQRRPNGSGFSYNLDGVRRVPYRLAELVRTTDQIVDVTEGEKDANRLADLGLCSTSIADPATADLSIFRNRQARIHADNDATGRDKALKRAAALAQVGAKVSIVHYPDVKVGGDVSDWLDQGKTLADLLARLDEAAEPFEPERPAINWPETTNSGHPFGKSQPNIRAFLEWRGVVLRHNEFSLRDEVTLDGKPKELDDASLRELRMEADELGLKPGREYWEDAVRNFCRKDCYHPLCDNYLRKLSWDGEQRLATCLSVYAGAEDTPLTRAIAEGWLVAAVRRIMKPGTKFDNCLVLESTQGAGKSTFAKVLAGEESAMVRLGLGMAA
jgi:hypothetical protein